MKALHSQYTTLLIDDLEKTPCIVYFGERLQQTNDVQIKNLIEQALPQGSLDVSPTVSIASTFADPTFLNPALKIHQNGQHWAPQWQVINTLFSDSALAYELTDVKTGLIIAWQLSVDSITNVWTINATIRNAGTQPVEIAQWLNSLPLSQQYNCVTSFSGRWVQEFQPQRHSVPLGALDFTNMKGRTSHDHFPGLLVSQGEPHNNDGEIIGCHLGWSGNHQQRIERAQNGLQQYQAGIALVPGEIILQPGDSFEAAPLYFTHSTEGLGGVSANFQRFVRKHILNFPKDAPRPVHINTWEALYFNHNQADLDSLAAAAKEIGAERFVLDDGWFLGRRDDTAGLGDWVVDTSLYPDELNPLCATLIKNQLGFGLWFEPEMVNHQSELYRQHPEWVLQLADHQQASGRNQWVLDITRDEVQNYLFDQISTLLNNYPIEYIKWDMNRDLLQAGNQDGRPAYYHYVRSLYQLIDRIRKTHAGVEIESCSSGGGRMDYGILQRTHRFWLSDCNDAKERQTMQQWASVFFPAEVLGAHIGPPYSHTTSRTHHLAVRAGTAMFGHMGIEWDIRGASEDEKHELSHYIELYKHYRTFIHRHVRRPLSSNDKHQTAFSVGDESKLLISIFQNDLPDVAITSQLKIPALFSDEDYAVIVLVQPKATGHLMKKTPKWMTQTTSFTGELLMKIGLPLPVLDPETVLVIQLTKQ